MKISEYKKKYESLANKYELKKEDLKNALNKKLDKIKLLESIYRTGEANSFSEQFKNSAFKEREELCKETSALYSILREDYKEVI